MNNHRDFKKLFIGRFNPRTSFIQNGAKVASKAEPQLRTYQRLLRSFLLLPVLFSPVIKGTVETPIVLWPGGAPGTIGSEPLDVPTLTLYLPPKEKRTGAEIIVCPGGGY